MKRFTWSAGVSHVRGKLVFFGFASLSLVLAFGWWFGVRGNSGATDPTGSGLDQRDPRKAEGNVRGGDETATSGSPPSPHSSAGTSGQPQQGRAKGDEPAALLAVLGSGELTINERVRRLQGMRGREFSEEEREAALAFLAGKDWPEEMSESSAHWLGDEVLTALRLQEPPWDGLAAALGEVAFQGESDPVMRDYIMQHLGHLWEENGARKEIDQALWRAVGTSDETTPGTALIALSRGYERDQQEKNLAEVRQRAFELARNSDTSLAVRVTALSIAGEGGGREVEELAAELATNPETPVILKKVALNIEP